MHRYGHNELEAFLPDECFLGQTHLAISRATFQDFAHTVSTAMNERPIQSFIASNPELLAQHLTGHLGRWVVPQQRLGAEHVVDFMIADQSSMGLHWIAVELESPRAKLFTKRGDPTACLSHAIRQLQDWRGWLSKNLAYARRKTSRGGLGLFGVRSRLAGIILIGRRSDLREQDEDLRNQMCEDLAILIHTYDWLIPDYALTKQRA